MAKKRQPPIERSCAACGATFTVAFPSDPKRYCRTACRPLGKRNVTGSKTCQLCSREYAPTSNRQRFCKDCHPGKSDTARLRRYGVTGVEWQRINARYDGMCWICQKKPIFAVDHDHETGLVRGGLCNRCNVALAYVETPEWWARALAYLREASDGPEQEAALH